MKFETSGQFWYRLLGYNADVVDLSRDDFMRAWNLVQPSCRNAPETQEHLESYDTVIFGGTIFRLRNDEKRQRALERKPYYDARGEK